MNMTAADDLESMVRREEEVGEVLTSLFEELKKEEVPLCQMIFDQAKTVGLFLELAMQVNSTLFEQRPNGVERRMRLELDGAFRIQLNTIRQLLRLRPIDG